MKNLFYNKNSESTLFQGMNERNTVFTLVKDILDAGLSVRIKATGRSMSPFLKGGEILTIRQVPSDSLRKGDLILFTGRYNSHVLHRLIIKQISLDNTFLFCTKGDALRAFDEPVHENEVLGKVCRIERIISHDYIEHINLESGLWRKINFLIALISFFKSRLYYSAAS